MTRRDWPLTLRLVCQFVLPQDSSRAEQPGKEQNMEFTTWFWGAGNAWPALFPHLDGPKGNTSISLIGKDGTTAAFHLVIDTGAGCSKGIREAALAPPEIILLTHLDPDHLNRMEIDTLIRMAHVQMLPKIRVVATATTWQQIDSYNRGRLEWVPATPGTILNLDVNGSRIEVLPLCAEDHRQGGVVYVVSAAGFRLGALFDKRNWGNVENEVENLDLAVMEANSIQRLSDKTGHVGLLDNIDFIRRLGKPPRMTVFTHYGTDDPEVLSVGSLCVRLPALATGFASCWAYSGMMIDSKALPPRNPVAVIEPDRNRFVGVEEKSTVHSAGMLHASVLTLVRHEDGRLAVYERHNGQSYPGCLDLLASGHMEPCDFPDPLSAAAREAEEELILLKDGLRIVVDSKWITPLAASFSLVSTDPHNNERSSVFGLRLPGGVQVTGSDLTDAGDPVALIVRALTLEELLEQYNRDPSKIADGLRRVLSELEVNTQFRTRVQSFLEAA
jgi:hypothetical protein